MPLYQAWSHLESELEFLSSSLQNFSAERPTRLQDLNFTIPEECLLEGLLSRIWQAWCLFCRSCVIESCLGTVDANGKVIEALPQAQSEQHVSSAAILAKQKSNKPYWGGVNGVLRNEPTWGDVDILAKILSGLVPANSGQLLASFSACNQSAKTLQAIRNGAAHSNRQSIEYINSFRSRYITFPIRHATHALFWTEAGSNDFLAIHAMGELKSMGLAAIS